MAKEFHGFRYTQMFGKARMEMKSALTFACLNLKKLANVRWKSSAFLSILGQIFRFYGSKPAYEQE